MIGSFLANMSSKLKSIKSCKISFLEPLPFIKNVWGQIKAAFKSIVIMDPFRHLDDVVGMA